MILTKKILSFFFAAGLLFTLSGCQKDQNPGSQQQTLERRIGTIIGLGSTISSQGTHLLQLDDGNTIFLKASNTNLDDPRYKEKKVEVSGVINYRNNDKATMEVQKVEVLNTVENQEESASTWKDYTDSEKGFSVRYRDDFEILNQQPTINSVTFSLKKNPEAETSALTQDTLSGGPAIVITLLQAKNTPEFLSFLKLKSFESKDLLSSGYSLGKVGKDNLDAYKKTPGLKDSVHYFVDGKTRYYQISFLMNESSSADTSNVFYEMLNSFALTTDQVTAKPDLSAPAQVAEESAKQEPVQTPDTTISETPAETLPPAPLPQPENYDTFVSEGFKFKILYPKKWYYSMGQTTDPNVLRHYDFGPKDEEQRVGLDLYTGKVPAGTTSTSGSKTITKVVQGASIELYVQGVGSRVYRLTGPSAEASTLLDMANSLEKSEENP